MQRSLSRGLRIWKAGKTMLLNEIQERNFFAKLDVGDCWEWTGYRMPSGHGMLTLYNKGYLAHRVAWEHLVGPIPEGMQLDHLCRNPRCVNPDHLEPVTQQENIRRGAAGIKSGWQQKSKTHCPQGHKYAGENLFIRKRNGSRECRACMRARDRARRLRMKAAA